MNKTDFTLYGHSTWNVPGITPKKEPPQRKYFESTAFSVGLRARIQETDFTQNILHQEFLVPLTKKRKNSGAWKGKVFIDAGRESGEANNE